MKHLSTLTSLCVCTLLAAPLSGCYPQADNPEQLRLVHEQNAAMRKEIARMQQVVKQAGDIEPGLADQIDTKEQQLAASLNELNPLKRQQTDTKLRVIQLQDRLDAFRSNFRLLQSETANLHKRP